MWSAAQNKKALFIIGSVALVVVVAVSVRFALMSTTPKPTADPVAEHDIHMYAEQVKSAKTYRSLPEAERQAFLEDEAAKLGGGSPQEEVTPTLVTMQCIDVYNTKLFQMARRYKDEIKEYQTALNHALMQVRDACYANYDPDGKILPEEMPHMQQH